VRCLSLRVCCGAPHYRPNAKYISARQHRKLTVDISRCPFIAAIERTMWLARGSRSSSAVQIDRFAQNQQTDKTHGNEQPQRGCQERSESRLFFLSILRTYRRELSQCRDPSLGNQQQQKNFFITPRSSCRRIKPMVPTMTPADVSATRNIPPRSP
jgi:hypothetical protein